MKTFRDLYIHLRGQRIDDFVTELSSHCHDPWSRAKDKEAEMDPTGMPCYCFQRKEDSGQPGATLFLFNKTGDTWYVSNIVPASVRALSHDQYNGILLDFRDAVVRPATEGTAIEVKVTEDHITVGDVAGTDVQAALVRFSSLANKSTGSSHPLDRKRWFEFLVLANQSNRALGTDLVISTLIELGWSEERAYELGLEFEFAEDLLSYFKGQ